MEINTDKQSGYDQKAFLQIRLHELLQRIDGMSGNLFFDNTNLMILPYRIIINDLCSVLQTIWSKLTPNEKIKAKQEREKIRTIHNLGSFELHTNCYGKRTANTPHEHNRNKITDGIFEFRILLEEFMDSHGFNPSKDDVSKSITKM